MGFLTCGNSSAVNNTSYVKCGGGDYSIVEGSQLTPDSLVYYSTHDHFNVSHGGNYVGGFRYELLPFSDVPDTGYILEVPNDLANYVSEREKEFFKATDLGNNYLFESFDTSTLSDLRSSQVQTDPFLESISTEIDSSMSTALFVGALIIPLVIFVVFHQKIINIIKKV